MADRQTGSADLISQSLETIDKAVGVNETHQKNILVAATGGGISFIGKIFEYATRLIFSIVVARAIGVEEYGLYVLALTVAPIASMVALLGLQTGVVHFLSKAISEKDDQRIWGIIQVCAGIPGFLSILLGIVFQFLAEPIAILGFHEPKLVPLFRVASLSIPLEALGFIVYQIIISYKKPKYSVLSNNIVMPLAKLILAAIFLVLGMRVFGVVLAHVIGSAIGLSLMIYYLNSVFPLRRPLQPATRQPGLILRYSLPVHLGWVLNTVRGTLETLVLGLVGLTAGIGVFSIAQRVSVLGSLLFNAMGSISTPIFAGYYHQREMGLMKNIYQTTTKWIVMFNFPLFLTFLLFGKNILSIFGSDFSSGATGLIILAIGNLFYTGTGLGATILDMTNHTKVNGMNSAIMIIITITNDLLLIPRWGVIGAATASALSTVIVNIVCLIEVLVLLKMQPYERGILKPIFAGIIAAVITYFINSYLVLPSLIHLVVGGVILWGIYLLVLFMMGFSKEDWIVINNLRSRFKILIPSAKQVTL